MNWQKRKPDRIHLSEPERDALLAIADEHDCRAKSGATAGSPSFRILIQDIASGRLAVVQRKAGDTPKSGATPKAKGEKKPWKGFWKFRAKWWKPIDDSTMMVDDAVAASGMTVEQLVGGGLELSDCGQWLAPPDRWKGWKYRKADAVAAEAPEPAADPVPEVESKSES